MAISVIETSKAKIIEVINKIGDSKLSIKNVVGKQTVYITIETTGERGDARNIVGSALKSSKFSIEEKLSNKSSELATFVKGKNVVIVYKNKKGESEYFINLLLPDFHFGTHQKFLLGILPKVSQSSFVRLPQS